MNPNVVEAQLNKNFIREGLIFKRSKFLKEWEEKWLVLTMNFIFIFSDKSKKNLNDSIDLRDVKSYKSYVRKDDEMIPAGFKIRSLGEMHYLCTKSLPQKWSWIVSMERVMDFKNVGKTLYNNMEYIKTKGFLAQEEFDNSNLEPQMAKKKSINQEKITAQNIKATQSERLVNQPQNLSAEEIKKIQDKYTSQIANFQKTIAKLQTVLTTNEEASKQRQTQLKNKINKLESDLTIQIESIKKWEEKEKTLNDKICQLELNTKQVQILRKNNEQLQRLVKRSMELAAKETQTIDHLETKVITQIKLTPIKQQLKQNTVIKQEKQQIHKDQLKAQPIANILEISTQSKPLLEPTPQKKIIQPTNNPIRVVQTNEIQRQRKSNFKQMYEMALQKTNIKKQPKLEKKDANQVADLKKKFENPTVQIKSPQKLTSAKEPVKIEQAIQSAPKISKVAQIKMIFESKLEEVKSDRGKRIVQSMIKQVKNKPIQIEIKSQPNLTKPLVNHTIMNSYKYELAETMIGFSLSSHQQQMLYINGTVINDQKPQIKPVIFIKEVAKQPKKQTVEVSSSTSNAISQVDSKKEQKQKKPLVSHVIMNSFKYELAETMVGFSLLSHQQKTFYINAKVIDDSKSQAKSLISKTQKVKQPARQTVESVENKNRVAETKNQSQVKPGQTSYDNRVSFTSQKRQEQSKPLVNHVIMNSFQYELAETMIGVSLSSAQKQSFYIKAEIISDEPSFIKKATQSSI